MNLTLCWSNAAKVHSIWQYTMQNSTKLEFFNTFKNDYTPFSYLGLTNKLSERKELVKFRIGSH